MQHGQRIQNSAPNTLFGRRAQTLMAYKGEPDERVEVTRSAARLAAEAAFAAPQVVVLAQQPAAKVMVRRTRSASLAAEPPPEPTHGAAIELTPKSARVFRVEAAPKAPSVEACSASSPPQAEESTLSAGSLVKAPAIPKPRRIGTDKRPGPVLHVVAPSEPTRPVEVRPPRLDWLAGELGRVTPVLEGIARAQAFTLVDERCAREWMRLSRKVDRLLAQIRA